MRFNLSEWALRHRSLVTYLMLVIAAAGVWSYLRLGRSEDPDFTVKTMVVQASWPGATLADTLEQVTDRVDGTDTGARVDEQVEPRRRRSGREQRLELGRQRRLFVR